jgi:4-hydroxybenzoate polyprenyltransferase
MVVWCPIWLARGRANLKREIARHVRPDAGSWPLNSEVLDYVQTAKKQGRRVVLATAADCQVAAAMQTRLDLFHEVLASDGTQNLSGKAKASALEQRFGARNFEYIGNSMSDLPVWQAAQSACVVGGNGLVTRVKNSTTVNRVFVTPRTSLKDWAQALRLHQWSKNLLLLIPIMSAHQWTQAVPMARVLLGMVAFSLCASSVYLINDLLDLESDRHHHSKQHRPFASGKIPLLAGLAVAPVLLALSAAAAFLLGWQFMVIIAVYYLVTLLYSLHLKQIALLDVLALAGLYGVRVLAGGTAAAVAVSDWLMMFSLFLFLSLAFAKRFTEIRLIRSTPDNKLKGRGYVGSDAELVSSMGVGSGFLSVLVLAMYIGHSDVTELYSRPEVLWLACPLLLYWISRVWLKAHRGTMHDDPILFALRDRQSWIVVLLLGAIGLAAGPK